jgi:hypothetical protein
MLGVALAVAMASASVAAPPIQDESGKVTRLIFRKPLILDEVKRDLADLPILRLSYTGDLGGVDQPGPGLSTAAAVESMRESTRKMYGVEPLVFEVVLNGAVSDAQLQPLVGNLVESQIFPADSEKVDRLPQGTTRRAAARPGPGRSS